MSRQVAYESIENVMLNKKGQPISKADISLKGFDMSSIIALKRYDVSAKRQVFWGWSDQNGVLRKYRFPRLKPWFYGYAIATRYYSSIRS